MIAVNTSIRTRLPPEMNSTNSVITRPMPVRVTVPTTMPAAAVATPMPIMLRAPATRPSSSSLHPWRAAAPRSRSRRKQAVSGCWVTTMKIMNTVAQKADRPGEKRSTTKHQTSTTTGSR